MPPRSAKNPHGSHLPEWDSTVTVRVWANGHDGVPVLLKPLIGVRAKRREGFTDGLLRFWLRNSALRHMGPHSQITDAAGSVFTVVSVAHALGFLIARVQPGAVPAPPPKPPSPELVIAQARWERVSKKLKEHKARQAQT